MNLTIIVVLFAVLLLAIGNEVNKVRRKVDELDEKLGHLEIDLKFIRNNMGLDLEHLRERIQADLKHEIEMHEIRTSN